MIFFRVIIFCFFILFDNLFAEFNIKINNLVEYKIYEDEIVYKITAKTKEVNNKNLKKSFSILSKEKMISENIFYTNGLFETKQMKIEFQKGYFLEGYFVMIDTNGFYKENEFKSEKTIYKSKQLDFENLFITIENKLYKKLKYSIFFEN